jgi:hypothetical protein
MKYKDMMGYPTKKKTIKREIVESTPKPTIVDELRKEFGEKMMEGPAYEYHKSLSKVDKTYEAYKQAVMVFEKELTRKGMKKEAKMLHRQFYKGVLGFKSWFAGLVHKIM